MANISQQNELSVRVHISESARSYLRKFVEDFIDSSFNPLFSHLRKALDSEAIRVLDCHHKQFFYLTSWFLQAHTARLKAQKAAMEKRGHAVDVPEDDDSFSLVAAVLNQETFITLNRFMQRSQDEKSWSDLTSGMKCLTQIVNHFLLCSSANTNRHSIALDSTRNVRIAERG